MEPYLRGGRVITRFGQEISTFRQNFRNSFSADAQVQTSSENVRTANDAINIGQIDFFDPKSLEGKSCDFLFFARRLRHFTTIENKYVQFPDYLCKLLRDFGYCLKIEEWDAAQVEAACHLKPAASTLRRWRQHHTCPKWMSMGCATPTSCSSSMTKRTAPRRSHLLPKVGFS